MATEQPKPRPVKKPVSQALDDNAPWMPPKWDIADANAIKALQAGTADPEQQKRALIWIVEKASMRYEQHFFPGPDGQRNTDFALGRAFVGQHIVALANINLNILRRSES